MITTLRGYINSIPDRDMVYYLRGYQLTYADITPFKKRYWWSTRRYLIRIPVPHTQHPEYGTRWREFIAGDNEKICVCYK